MNRRSAYTLAALAGCVMAMTCSCDSSTSNASPPPPPPQPQVLPTKPHKPSPNQATQPTQRSASEQARIDAEWRKPRELDILYDRIAEDLQEGRPLIIASYYGMWWKNSTEPDKNLNWGGLYGHGTMLKKRTLRSHVVANYVHHDWTLVYEEEADRDPLRTFVLHQRIKPNPRWRSRGVTEPFDAYLVMQAWSHQENSAVAMTKTLRQGKGRDLELEDGTLLDVGDAQVTGYFGHNFFYDYEDFHWTGLDQVPGRPERPKGVFAVGCSTGRVPGFGRLVGENVVVVLYSLNLMGSEGYSTLALTDGLLRHMTSKEITRHANRTYRVFQQIPNPGRRVGKPFASHNYKLYLDPK